MRNQLLRYSNFPPHQAFESSGGFSCQTVYFPWTSASSCSHNLSPCVPTSLKRVTEVQEFQPVVHRLRFSPRLRPRLTLSGRTFLRKPWAFDGEDSHFTFATHANILSCLVSTEPYSSASPSRHCSPTITVSNPSLRYQILAPFIFGAPPLDQ